MYCREPAHMKYTMKHSTRRWNALFGEVACSTRVDRADTERTARSRQHAPRSMRVGADSQPSGAACDASVCRRERSGGRQLRVAQSRAEPCGAALLERSCEHPARQPLGARRAHSPVAPRRCLADASSARTAGRVNHGLIILPKANKRQQTNAHAHTSGGASAHRTHARTHARTPGACVVRGCTVAGAESAKRTCA